MSDSAAGTLAGGRISYLFLLVFDLRQMLAFYHEILGFQVDYAEEGRFAFLSLGGAAPMIALYPGRPAGSEHAPYWFLVIDVDDLEATVAALRSRSVEVGHVHDVPYGRAVMCTDPEGNQIELHEPTV